MKKIKSATDYSSVMERIDLLMAKGSQNVLKEELLEIRELARAAQEYEQQTYKISSPKTLTGMIEMRMYEMKLRRKDLAEKLKISSTKLSLIMNGKQRPDIDFLKAVHRELNVDAEFILQNA